MSFFDGIFGFREGGGHLSVEFVLFSLLITFLLSQAVAWVYLRTHRGVSYSGTMARTLVVLALIVALVMMVIGNNVARAFGLFGALALIRFRTPVKDANDTVFLFFSVAIGIATGTGNAIAGVVGTAVICAILLYLSGSGFGNPLSHDGLLRFQLPAGENLEDELRNLLGLYCNSFDLLHIREVDGGATVELSYQIKMFDSRYASKLVAEMEARPEISHLSLLIQDKEAAP